MAPKETIRKEFENKVCRNLYPEFDDKTLTPKFSIDDHIRITKKKKTFDKGYTQRWTDEVFKISKIQLTIPVTYKITDYNGEEIQGLFYEKELQKTKQDIFRIQKIIKQQGSKSLVKWWALMIRLTRGLITKALTNYRAKVYNVRYCVAWLSQIIPRSVPYVILQWFTHQRLDSQFSPRLYRTTVS